MNEAKSIKKQSKSRPNIRKVLGFLSLSILPLILLIFLLATDRFRIGGDAMRPTLLDGQEVHVNRIAYWFNEPERGELILLQYPRDPRRTFLKRIVGLPGDVVEVRETQLFINDEPVDEPYILQPIRYSGSWVVPEDEVFVFGDNRNNSQDSSNFGGVPMRLIVGRVWLIYSPIDQLQFAPHHVYPNLSDQ